jgi:hypothetical protein
MANDAGAWPRGSETSSAGNLTTTTATLNGVANPDGTNTSAWFQWVPNSEIDKSVGFLKHAVRQ